MSNIGALKARKLLEELQINDISFLQYLDEMCMARGLYVKREALDSHEARLVLSSSAGDVKGIITVGTDESYETRSKFSIAHELGHFELHRDHTDFNCNVIALNEWFSKQKAMQMEVEANCFASELLMPAKFIKPLIKNKPPSLTLIKQISEQFQTSHTASAIKFIEHTEEACALVFFDKTMGRFHVPSKLFTNQRYWIPPGPLSKDTQAYAVANGKTAAQIMSDVAFDSWVDISEKPEWLQEKLSDKCLKEQAIFFPRLQKGISLLWAKDASLIWN